MNMSKRNKKENDISKEKPETAGKDIKGTLAKRLRTCNIRMLILSVTILMALCVLMLARIRALNETIKILETRVETLTNIVVEQQTQLSLLTEGQGGSLEASAPAGGKKDTEEGEKTETDGAEASIPEITAAHKVYLTFDDGPSTNTQEILDILEEYDVKATFFVVGKEGEAAQESMRKIVEAGHTLGMHSYSHKYSDLYASVENFAGDFAKQQEYIYEVTGVTSRVYRFPGGSSNTVSDISMKEFAKYLDSQGVRFFDWNISSGDGGSYLYPVEELVEHCTEKIANYGTSIILMHDVAGKKTTVEALPIIIEKILAMEDTVILPITDETTPVQHIKWQDEEQDQDADGTM